MKKALFSLFVATLLTTYVHDTNACEAGGPGSVSCSVSTSVGFLGLGGTRTVTITCGSGFYACCSTTGASCVPNEGGGGNQK